MAILNETFTLNNGRTIPKLGFGTWLIDDGTVAQAVQDAAAAGYRHFDTAQAYDNEHGVGVGLRATGLPREELFVTTKVQAEFKDYQSAKQSINESLRQLDLTYLDLLLIHSPKPWKEFHGDNHYFDGNVAAWRAMEEAVQAGKVRSIGVSNFEQVDLDNILQHCTIKPAVNQLLVHVANTPFDLIDYTKQQNILVEAYSPMGHGEILHNPVLQQMAAKYQVSIAQLCIRYCLQLGTLPLPKSNTASHIAANAQVDFVITDADMDTLKNMPPIQDYGESGRFPVYGGQW